MSEIVLGIRSLVVNYQKKIPACETYVVQGEKTEHKQTSNINDVSNDNKIKKGRRIRNTEVRAGMQF